MGYFKSLDSAPDGAENAERHMPKFATVEYTLSTIVDKLHQINSLSDTEIRDIIFRQYKTLLDYDNLLSDNKSREAMQELFKNKRFLTNLVYCAECMQFDTHNITCCNKLAFDYMVFYGDNADPDINILLMELSYRINIKTILPLSAIIGIEPAKYLSMLRFSSFDESKNVKRVNKYIIRSGLNHLREQGIIDVYSRLFERFSILFTETMLTLPEPDYTPEERFRYDEMSKAMIDILDNMPSEEIWKVLENYASTYELKGQPPMRFSMKDLHTSYFRVTNVIRTMLENGIIIP